MKISDFDDPIQLAYLLEMQDRLTEEHLAKSGFRPSMIYGFMGARVGTLRLRLGLPLSHSDANAIRSRFSPFAAIALGVDTQDGRSYKDEIGRHENAQDRYQKLCANLRDALDQTAYADEMARELRKDREQSYRESTGFDR